MKVVIALLWLALLPVAGAAEPSTLQVETLGEGLYRHISYHEVAGYGRVDSNGLVAVSAGRALIVDTPWSAADTEALLDWIEAQDYEPAGALATHFHDDSAVGLGVLNARGVPTYASQQTNALLLAQGSAVATQVFDGESFTLGQGLLEVFFPGPGHSRDNVVVWLPRHQLLFGGCFVKGLAWNSLGFVGDAAVDRWDASLARVQARYPEVQHVVPGHGDVGDGGLLAHTRTLVQTAEEASR